MLVRNLESELPLRFLIGSSSDFVGQTFDVIFLDGGRDYDVVVGHFKNVGEAARICAFHDIECRFAPDIKVFWNEVKNKYASYEEILYHPNNSDIMGIGILRRQDRKVKLI